MSQLLCYIIENKELYLEKILIENDHIPLFFTCRDSQKNLYISMLSNPDKNIYIVSLTSKNQLSNLFSQKITMKDIIIQNGFVWEIAAQSTIQKDKAIKKSVSTLSEDDLPTNDSFFQLVTDSDKEYADFIKRDKFNIAKYI